LLLTEAGIPVVETKLSKIWEEAVAIIKSISHPVVLKIVSKQVIHKSDLGGGKLNLTTDRAERTAYEDTI
jgi:acetate---CoA ligase (ADP-forming)